MSFWIRLLLILFVVLGRLLLFCFVYLGFYISFGCTPRYWRHAHERNTQFYREMMIRNGYDVIALFAEFYIYELRFPENRFVRIEIELTLTFASTWAVGVRMCDILTNFVPVAHFRCQIRPKDSQCHYARKQVVYFYVHIPALHTNLLFMLPYRLFRSSWKEHRFATISIPYSHSISVPLFQNGL